MAGLGSSGGSGGLIGVVEGDPDAGLRGVSRSASEGALPSAVLEDCSCREAALARTAVRTSRRLFLSQVSVSERLLLPLLMVAMCCSLDVTLSAAGRGGGGELISTVEAAVKAEGRFGGPDPSPFAGKRSSERIHNIVVRPNASGLYYLVTENCGMQEFFGSIFLRSIMAVSFEGRPGSMVSLSPAAQPSQPSPLVQVSVLSYVWPVASPSGPPPASAPIAGNWTELDSLANIYTAALSSDGSHLIMGAYASGLIEKSWVVSLDVISGVRLSTPVSLGEISGLAFSPNHTALYMADPLIPPRVLVAEVAASTPLLPASLNTTVFLTLSPPNFTRPVFGPYSFAADGSCLYFLDGRRNRVWAFHIASRKLIPLYGSGLPLLGTELPFPSGSTESLMEIAVTSDGRNVFFTDLGGELHLVALDSACGSPLSNQIVARRPTKGMWGLAISPDDKYVYVGTRDGRILKLDLGQLP
ncbi:hypothetical protein CBR_g8193 [Chara braunii]|uniref:SMP-30/Gluconolactonase/LRE-like region domain-containing protein n=1 Tax=Chara braunii TaxID=69332 RepID=A0A388KLQ7_CHABU|nr:hypothetical protein CBR_g8193 [Chara braunii]|eukprot:GBG70893.1 hypothetical protein CBR_g8193 [Chara braunii]